MTTARRILVSTVLVAAAGASADGANCALRNPNRQIYEIFPEATSYRSVVAIVDGNLKRRIEDRLGSSLARSDIGKHTAYVVLKETVPIGVVHARTEAGARGSIELVWALDLTMKIKDFRVQRSRDKHTDVIKSEAFRAKMVGRDLRSIQDLLTAGNDDIDLAALEIPPSAATIALKVVLCAAKTRLITELAFQNAILPARLLGLVHEYFPETDRVTRVVSPLDDATRNRIAAATGTAPALLEADTLTVLRAMAGDGATLGALAFAIWSAHPGRPETWWAVSPDGRIQDIVLVGDVDEREQDAFAALRRRDLAELVAAESPSARCGAEVLAILAAHGYGTLPSTQSE